MGSMLYKARHRHGQEAQSSTAEKGEELFHGPRPQKPAGKLSCRSVSVPTTPRVQQPTLWGWNQLTADLSWGAALMGVGEWLDPQPEGC